MQIEISEAVPSDEPILANLLSLYLHDFSEVLGGLPRPDGRFEYNYLPAYFVEPNRTALLIRVNGALGGFAMVSRGSIVTGSPDTWDLCEFFVVRGLRRKGVGCKAASAVFSRFGGDWEVRVLERNTGAMEFWPHAVRQHTDGEFEKRSWENDLGSWTVFQFHQTG